MRCAVPLSFLLCCALALVAYGKVPDTINLDFVDTPVQEVARTLSLAYEVPILAEASVQGTVTFHLANHRCHPARLVAVGKPGSRQVLWRALVRYL